MWKRGEMIAQWTLFVRGIHGKTLTVSSMKLKGDVNYIPF